MLTKLKNSFAWQVVGGFVLGTMATIALQPAEASDILARHLATQAEEAQ